jgi:hypothetical protein
MPAPRLESSFFVDGFAKDVVTRGQLVYALDQPDGFTILDLSRPGALTPTGSLTLVSPIPLRAQLDVSESSSRRLAVVVGGGPVQIYDVSDARKPVHAATYRMPGAAQRVALQGSRLFVANGPAGLQVVDLDMPAAQKSGACSRRGRRRLAGLRRLWERGGGDSASAAVRAVASRQNDKIITHDILYS